MLPLRQCLLPDGVLLLSGIRDERLIYPGTLVERTRNGATFGMSLHYAEPSR